jgi:hydrogenase-4 component B
VNALALLVAAGLGLGLGLALARWPRAWRAATLSGLGLAGLAAGWGLLKGATLVWPGAGATPAAAWFALRLDPLSAFFLLLVAVVGGLATVYAGEYWSDQEHPASAPWGRVMWNGFWASLVLVLLAGNGILFLIAWELFAVSAFFLITLNRAPRAVRAAGWLYLGASHAGTLCLFAFFASLAAATGGWMLGPVRDRADLAPLFWLALAGFGLKAGVFPLHIWLPAAHANAPSHVSAVLSGVAIKMGIYGLVRFSGWLSVPPAAGWVVAGLGSVSAVLGVAFALGQHDLKRLLAYHSVENIGIILMGLGFGMVAAAAGHPTWGVLALAGGLLHVWNHGLFKALLFLGAGSVLHATGTRAMSRLGGLWARMPWTAGLFALGAVAISGLPPLNGFVSEWLVYRGLFDAALAHEAAAWAAMPTAVLLAMTGALALACFIKVCGVVFLGLPRSPEAEQAHECGPAMRGAMLGLAAACGGIGLGAVGLWPVLARVAAAWNPAWAVGPAPRELGVLTVAHGLLALAVLGGGVLVWRRTRTVGQRRAVTWDCGYAAPSPRMQYTAASFAGMLTEWFAWILHPHRHLERPEAVLPARACWETHTPETVLEEVVEPVSRGVLRLSTRIRRLQHGRVQAYLGYVLLGVLGLAVLVLWAWAD